jgi:hypothetical protein
MQTLVGGIVGGCVASAQSVPNFTNSYTGTDLGACYSGGCCSVSGCCSGAGSGCCSGVGSGCCSGAGSGCCSGAGSGCCSGARRRLEEIDRRLCDASACCSTSGCRGSVGGASSANPYTPRYHNYTITIPAFTPKINPAGVTYPKYYNFDTNHGDPIGVAINGVLIFGHHLKFHSNGTVSNVSLKRDFDSCGGHSDIKGRYHYHAPPICLMSNMHQIIPSTGNKFMYDSLNSISLSRWPTYSKNGPSPIFGFALDGFPIYGPYDSNSKIVTTSQLDKCNFHSATKRYYFTPDYPFAPTCLVGHRGTYEEVISSSTTIGTCPFQRYK